MNTTADPRPTSEAAFSPEPVLSRHIDGNAVAGTLATLFGVDITGARGTCASCGHRSAIAEAYAYLDGPGAVLRCPECDNLLLRWAVTPVSTWMEMPGLAGLEIAARL